MGDDRYSEGDPDLLLSLTPEPEPDEAARSDQRVETPDRHFRRSLATVAVAVLATIGLLLALAGTSSAPADDEAAADPDQVDETTTAAPTNSRQTAAPTTAPTTLPAGQFLLGEPTALWLFYGGADVLQRLDLDTGQRDEYGLRAYPVATAGEQLVLSAEASGAIGWVDLADPAAQAQGWKEAKIAIAADPSHLWLLQKSDDPVWTLFDIGLDLIVEQRPISDAVALDNGLAGRAGKIVPGPDIVATPNGIYRFDDGVGVRVGEGRVLAYDQSVVLIETCGRTLDDCTTRWVDPASWQPVDRATPTGSPLRFAEIVGGGRWLHSIDRAGDHPELLSLETGQVVPLADPSGSPAVSPDGRWLATVSTGGGPVEVTVVDLDTGKVALRFNDFSGRGRATVLFAPRPVAG